MNLTWVAKVENQLDAKKLIERALVRRQQDITYSYAIIYRQKIAGGVSLMYLSQKRPVEISYWLAASCAGKGLATQSVMGLTDYAFNRLAMDRVVIRAQVNNQASNKVALRSGYHLAGRELGDGKVINTYQALAG